MPERSSLTPSNLANGEVAALLNSVELSRRAVQSLLTASERMVEQAHEAAKRISDASASGAKRVDTGAQRVVDQLQLALIERAEEFDRSIERVMQDLTAQVEQQSGQLVQDNRNALNDIQARIVTSLLEAQEGIAEVTRSAQAKIAANHDRLESRMDAHTERHVEQLTEVTNEAVARITTATNLGEQAAADAAHRIGQTAERIVEGSRHAVERMMGESDQVSGRIEAATSGAVRELKSAAKGYAEHLEVTAELIASHLAQTKGAADAVAQLTKSTVDETVINATENVLVALDRVEQATTEQIDRLVGSNANQIQALQAIRDGASQDVSALEERLDQVVSDVIRAIGQEHGDARRLLSDFSETNHKYLTEAVAKATQAFADSVNVNASAVADAMGEATDQLAARVADEMAELPHQWRRAAADAGRVMNEATVAEIDRLCTQVDAALIKIDQAGERTASALTTSGTQWTRNLNEALDALVDELNRSAHSTDHAARTFSTTMHTSIDAATGVLGDHIDSAADRLNQIIDQVTARAGDVTGDQIDRVTKIARELRDTADRSAESVLDALTKLSGQSVLLDASIEAAKTQITEATVGAGDKISATVQDAGDYLAERLHDEVATAQRTMQQGSQQVADRMINQSRDLEVRITQRADDILTAMADRDTELAVWSERFYGAVDSLQHTTDGLAEDRKLLGSLAEDLRVETSTALSSFHTTLDVASERTSAAITQAGEQTSGMLADLVDELERRLGLELERLIVPVRSHLAQVSEQQRRLAVVMDRMESIMARREEAVARDEAIADRMLELVEDAGALVEEAVGERALTTLAYLDQAEATSTQLEVGGAEAANMLMRLTQATQRLTEISVQAEATRTNLERVLNRATNVDRAPVYPEPAYGEPFSDRYPERARDRFYERIEPLRDLERVVSDRRTYDEPYEAPSPVDRLLDRAQDRPAPRRTTVPGGRRQPPPRWAPPRS